MRVHFKAMESYGEGNHASQAMVADKVELAATWGSRLKGLLGRRSIAPGEGLHIVPCNSIHMFFMRFAIDVAFLAHDGRVVKLVHTIRPWRATSSSGWSCCRPMSPASPTWPIPPAPASATRTDSSSTGSCASTRRR